MSRRLALLAVLAALGVVAYAGLVRTDPTTSSRVLKVAFGGAITSIDPAVAANERSLAVSRLVFEQLVGYDRGASLQPLLAEAMPAVSADGRTYTFTLRSGVRFVRPDGSVLRELAAGDVVATFDRLHDPRLGPEPFPEASTLFANVEGVVDVVEGRADRVSGVEARGARTVVFRLVEPDVTFLYRLATSFGSIVPADVGGRDTTAFAANPVGTGPYLLAGHVAGQSMTFVRNPNYWQPGQPRADRVEVALGVDPAVAVDRVRAGELDVTGSGIPPGQFATIVGDPSLGGRVHRRTVMETQYLAMDTQSDSPLRDARVRRAIAHAVDRDNVIRIVGGRGVVARCIFPPQLTAHDPSCDPYPRDLERAKALMAEAGVTGFDTRIFVVNEDPDPLIGDSIAQDLAAIGIRVEVVAEEFATWIESIGTPGRAPLSYPGWNVDYPDPANFVDPILTCGSVIPAGSNFARYCNPDVDRLAAVARREQDPGRRVERYRELERRIMADVPWVPLRHPVRATLVSSRVVDFYFHPIWGYDLRGYAVGP